MQDPIYLPARSELDVQMWRMTDNQKRKVWFEWSASAFLPASSLRFTPSPPTSVLSSQHAPNRRTSGSSTGPDTLSPRWDGSANNRSAPGGGAFSPMVDAFQSAPSPHIGGAVDGRMQGIVEEPGEAEGWEEERILVGYTRLHNPQGRSSFVGL